MLSIKNLTSGYGNTMIVQDFSLDIGPAQVIGLLGRNGVGKTTALKTVMGLLPTHAGRVVFNGIDITEIPTNERARHGLAYVPQGRMIFSSLTVEDNMRLGIVGTGQKNGRKKIQEMYELFPILHEKRRQLGSELSGGQQQILALARALVTKPKLILLDEPSEGVQPSVVDEIGNLIKLLSIERGVSIVLVEQNFDFATNTVSEVYLMDRGAVVHKSTSEEIKLNVEAQKKYLGL